MPGGAEERSENGPPQLTPLAREFCAFLAHSTELQAKLDSFLQSRCNEFKGCSLDGEHKLEWTTAHNEYIAFVEQHLEAFLRERGVSADDLRGALEAALGGAVWSLPLLRSLEYQSYIAQMIARACAPALRREALQSEVAGAFGGVWKYQPQRTDARTLDRFLKRMGAPWILRRLNVLSTADELCIVEMAGTLPTYTFLLSRRHGGGLTLETVCADGQERAEPGNATTRVTARLEGGELLVEVRRPAHVVPVAAAVVAIEEQVVGEEARYSVADGGHTLRCQRRPLLLSTGDASGCTGGVADGRAFASRDEPLVEYFERCAAGDGEDVERAVPLAPQLPAPARAASPARRSASPSTAGRRHVANSSVVPGAAVGRGGYGGVGGGDGAVAVPVASPAQGGTFSAMGL
eukprot:TRINITY_DN14964_c0_g1_i4.p1 TRINITY_DN14964_c0_g1~~TRINITY_DN14964_c0_g1_i4.p1  ORF type:complete len:420 (-),score=79.12 TRINITY_DN14964_c0_g1_i4:90-1307(-)